MPPHPEHLSRSEAGQAWWLLSRGPPREPQLPRESPCPEGCRAPWEPPPHNRFCRRPAPHQVHERVKCVIFLCRGDPAWSRKEGPSWEALASLICLGRLCYSTKVLYRLYFCTISFCNFLQIKTHFYCSLYVCTSSRASPGPGPGRVRQRSVPCTATEPAAWSTAWPVNSPQPIGTPSSKKASSVHSTDSWLDGARRCSRHQPSPTKWPEH